MPRIPAVTTLASFKRFLAEPGATVQVVRNDWTDPAKTRHPLQPKAGYFDPKQVSLVQSNSVKFTTGGWLAFPKASQIRCEGDRVTCCMQQDGTFSDVLVYQLTYAAEPAAAEGTEATDAPAAAEETA